MTTTPHPSAEFRLAVETADLDAIVSLLADDIELFSPVLADPFVGKPQVGRLFGVLVETFADIEVLDEFRNENRSVLSFRARVGTESIHIVDLLTFDDEGRIETFVVTARPLPGLEALANAVAPRLDEIL